MGRDYLEYHFTKKRFLWNSFLPIFPPFYVYDGLYVLEKIFPRFDHYHNGEGFLGWVGKYHKFSLDGINNS